jgi:aminoglycoside phosphotransferase (APT) family kinase protein
MGRTAVADLDPALGDWLVRSGLAHDRAAIVAVPLAGGVASDIWRIDTGGRRFVIKRALAKLRVARDWRAPVSRNANEVAWLNEAGRIAPENVPRILAHDVDIGAFAMEYLAPGDHPVWKAELHAGRADPVFAARVGERIAAIHAATANRSQIAAEFGSDAMFMSLRLEPYLEATAEAHPDLAPKIELLIAQTLASKHALVHGDISPKNILVGPHGPVFLDAECAWYGDPAFDLAFCLNHLLLKCLWTSWASPRFIAAFDALAESYLDHADWEARSQIEARVARLLPGLLLARIDGKSPVEYVTKEADRDRVRRVARPLIADPVETLAAVRGAWARELSL